MLRHAILALAAALALSLSSPAAAQNKGGTLFASQAQTAATLNSADIVNNAGRSGIVAIDVTARTSGTYTFTIQGKDPASGKYFTVLTSAGIASVTTVILRVGPALTAAANLVANDNLPMVWRLQAVGTSTPVMTFSAGYLVMQ
jgi:hypothetical protein